MKKLLRAVLIILLIGSTFALFSQVSISPEVDGLPSRVQTARGTNNGDGLFLAVKLGSTPVNGNSLVLTFGSYGGPTSISSISQTGATWTLQKAKQFDVVDSEIWLASNVSGAGTTITLTLDNAPANAVANVCEYSGLSDSIPLDQTATSSGNSQNADSGTTATTTQASELWVGSTSVGGSTDASNDQTSPTNGFTLLDGAVQGTSSNGVSNAYLEKIVSAAGTANSGTSFGLLSNLPWAGCIATFKATVSGNLGAFTKSPEVNSLPSRVQSSTGSAVFAVFYTITLESTPTNGDAIFIVASTSDSNHIASINQTGARWAQVTYAGFDRATELWAALNVQNAGTTITVSLTGTSLSVAIAVEYSGILSSNATDKTASNSGSGTSADTGTTATTTQANELWIAGIADFDHTGTNSQSSLTSSFSQVATSLVISPESSSVVLVAGFYEKLVSVTGTANTGCTLNSSATWPTSWQGVISTFKAEVSGNSGSTTTRQTSTASTSSISTTSTSIIASTSGSQTTNTLTVASPLSSSPASTRIIISTSPGPPFTVDILILIILAITLVVFLMYQGRRTLAAVRRVWSHTSITSRICKPFMKG